MVFPDFLRGVDGLVKMVETRYRYFPAVFEWRGERVEVERVRRFWTDERRGLTGQVSELHHFSVSTARGEYVLTHDLRRERWTVLPHLEERVAA